MEQGTSSRLQLGPKPMEELVINEIGFTILHDPKDAIADIIFVHGLQGHPRKTWACDQTQGLGEATRHTPRGLRKLFSGMRGTVPEDPHKLESGSVFWPLDLLPIDCENSRILTWGYDSKVSNFFGGAASQSNIRAYARNFLPALKIQRRDCQGRQVIFVAHSLGGIIVKDVLHRAANSDKDPRLLDIYTSIHAILFLGTPHRGSNITSVGEVIRKIVSVSGFDASDQNIRALRINSTELENIHENFMKLYERQDRHSFQVFTFREDKGPIGISYLKLNEKVVEDFSSEFTSTEPTQTINADHMSMCRFRNRTDPGYQQVVGVINFLVSEIQEKRDLVALENAGELAGLKTGSPSQTTIDSTSYSLNDVERKCIALLIQNTSNAAEYRSSLPNRVEGTCKWILSNPQYRLWSLKNETCLLWISGYPGTGKTILSTYLLEYLDGNILSQGSQTTLCYFFCDSKIHSQRDGMAILRSLIHQVVLRHPLLIKHVKAAYDFQGPEFYQNFYAIWKVFLGIVNDRKLGSIIIVIDAIDECEDVTREQFLREVVTFTEKSRLAHPDASCIKFVITSRPELGRQCTSNLWQIDLSQNYVEEDLDLVIKSKVDGIAQRTRCKPKVKAYLKDALESRADRTFLWVTIVLQLLETELMASPAKFKLIIDELPKTLTATYERFLQGIAKEHHRYANQLLHLIVGSVRPLTVGEIRTILAIQDGHRSLAAVEEDALFNTQEYIGTVLGPLVRIWDSQVHLVHQSFKEFLQTLSTKSAHPLASAYGIDLGESNLILAKACVSYLLLDDFKRDIFSQDQSNTKRHPTCLTNMPSEPKTVEELWDPFGLEGDILFDDSATIEANACASIEKQFDFFGYAARYWSLHFSSALPNGRSAIQSSVLVLSDATRTQGLNWLRYYWNYSETDLLCPRDFDTVVVVSYFGHSTSLEALMKGRVTIERAEGPRAIYWASRMGHRQIVDFLLGYGVDPDLQIINGHNCFTAAIQFNRVEVVKRLLESEGHLSEERGYRVNYAVRGGRTPLSIAASNGLVEIAGDLLQHRRIKPDIEDVNKWTPLFWSTGGGNLDVLQLLLADNRVSANHLDKSGRNVLSWAASEGKLEIVKTLMSLNHLKADEADQDGRTALSWAAGNGHLETTAYLRQSQRIDVSRKDNSGRNALSWACSGSHHRVVDYLIKHDPHGADEADVDGWAPLAWALFTNSPKTVQILLTSGLVDVNKRDVRGSSPLSWAAGYGYVDVVQLLLKTRGIEVNSKDILSAKRYPEIAKILEEYHT